MVSHLMVIFLCLGILSILTGCAVDPYPYRSFASYAVIPQHGTYQGPPHQSSINYERRMDEEELAYRRHRSAQERAQELKYQQWEQERARERDPRWEGLR